MGQYESNNNSNNDNRRWNYGLCKSQGKNNNIIASIKMEEKKPA